MKSTAGAKEKDSLYVLFSNSGARRKKTAVEKQPNKVEKKNFYRMERSYGSFTRSFRLPSEVETDKAKASFKAAVLEIRIPKSEEAKEKEKKVHIE